MRKVFDAVVFCCLLIVTVVIVLAPLWVLALGLSLFFCSARFKQDGASIVAGVIGFILAVPYSAVAKRALDQLGVLP